MKIVVVYKEFSDHGREVREWISELKTRAEGLEIEMLNPETKEGEGFCQAYGILDYPSVVVAGEEGKAYFSSVGKPLPTFNEVLSYVVN